MKADKRGVNVVWQTCCRHIGPVAASCIETNGERSDWSTLNVSLINAAWLDTIFVYIQTWAKQRWTDRGCMTTAFWMAAGVFPQQWQHNASLFPVSQQRSVLFDNCWLSVACERRHSRGDIFTAVVRAVWSVRGSWKRWDSGDEGETLHNRLSAVPSGHTNHALALWPPLNFLLSSSMFSGVFVTWETYVTFTAWMYFINLIH